MFQLVKPASSPSRRASCITCVAHAAAVALLFMGRFGAAAGPVRHWQVTLIAPPPVLENAIAPVVSKPRAFRAVPAAPKLEPKMALELPPALTALAFTPLVEVPGIPVPRLEFSGPELSGRERPRARPKTDGFDEWIPAAAQVALKPTMASAGFAGIETSGAPARSVTARTGLFSDSSAEGGLTRARAAHTGEFPGTVAATIARIPGQVVPDAQFGDAAASVAIAGRKSAAAPALSPVISDVEILFKPRPAYTDEARRLRIEGEVLLEMRFGLSGQARVLRVVRGLGHGLDENAIAAAREIRFRSAADTTAIVHIIFRLAY